MNRVQHPHPHPHPHTLDGDLPILLAVVRVVELFQVFHVLLAAQEYGTSAVDVFGHDVEDTLSTGSSDTASLWCQLLTLSLALALQSQMTPAPSRNHDAKGMIRTCSVR